jgi:hypothetical protein
MNGDCTASPGAIVTTISSHSFCGLDLRVTFYGGLKNILRSRKIRTAFIPPLTLSVSD